MRHIYRIAIFVAGLLSGVAVANLEYAAEATRRAADWDMTQPQATAITGLLAIGAASIAYLGVRKQVNDARSQRLMEKAYREVGKVHKGLSAFVKKDGVLQKAAEINIGAFHVTTAWPVAADKLEMQGYLLKALGLDDSYLALVAFSKKVRSWSKTPSSVDRRAVDAAARSVIETTITDLRSIGG